MKAVTQGRDTRSKPLARTSQRVYALTRRQMKALMIVGVLLVLTLIGAACGGAQAPVQRTVTVTRFAGAGSVSAASVSPTPGSPFEFANGVTVAIKRVDEVARRRCYEPHNDACVLVQMTVGNVGKLAFPLGGNSATIDLYYGVNRYRADDATYAGDPGAPEPPQRVAPGSKVLEGAYFRIPPAQLQALTATFELPPSGVGPLLRHTFTGLSPG